MGSPAGRAGPDRYPPKVTHTPYWSDGIWVGLVQSRVRPVFDRNGNISQMD